MIKHEDLDLLREYELGEISIDGIRDLLNREFRSEKKNDDDYYFEMRNYALRNGLDELTGWIDYYMSFHYSDASDFENSEKFGRELLDYFEKIDDSKGIVYAYNALSNCYDQMDLPELAIEMSMKGIKIAKNLEDKSVLNMLVGNVIIIFERNNKFDMAKEFLEYFDLTNNDEISDLSKTLINEQMHAEVYVHDGHPIKAMKILEAHVKGKYLEDNVILYNFSFKLYALALHSLGRDEEARKYFLKSIDMVRNKYAVELCENKFDYGIFESDLGNIDESIEIILRTYELAKKHDYQRYVKRCSLLLYKLFKEKEDYEKAIEYLEIFDEEITKSSKESTKDITARFNLLLRDEAFSVEQIIDNNIENITKMGESICSSVDIDFILNKVKAGILKFGNFEIIGLSIYSEEDNNLECNYVQKDGKIIKKTLRLDESMVSNYCIKTKKSIFSNNFGTESYKYRKGKSRLDGDEEFELRTAVFIPLMYEDKVIAVFSLQSSEYDQINAKDISFIKLIANYIAIATKNTVRYEKLQRIAIYDSLTGLLTKSEILKETEILIKKIKEKDMSLAVCMMDMDSLKEINDEHGHVYGDEVLRIVTKTINKSVRKADLLGRYGGDEFLLILPNTENYVAYKIIERIREKIDNLKIHLSNGEYVHVTLSGGIYVSSVLGDVGIDYYIEKADEALYIAKKNGKNKIIDKHN